MAKITRKEKAEINALLVRQAKYEARYTSQFRRELARQYRLVADHILESGVNSGWENLITTDRYRVILQNIWTNAGTKEAVRAWDTFVKPYLQTVPTTPYSEFETKDLFGDIARFLLEGSTNTQQVGIFQQILSDIFVTYSLSNLAGIAETTRERIQTVIERGIEDGEGAEIIARNIRKEASGDINRNRSVIIARTEVVGATSRARLLAVMASPLRHAKKWSPMLDSRTRLPHYQMRDYPAIPVEADFQIANSRGFLEPLLCPGDTSRSSPSNFIQCRCSLTFEVLRDENGRVIRK